MNPKKILLWILFVCPAIGFCQTNDSGEYENTIEKAVAIHNRKDTVKLNEVVELQLSTDQPVESFNKLYIDGIEVAAPILKISKVDQILYVTFNEKVFDVVDDFVSNQGASTVYVPVYVSVGNASGIVAKASDPLYMVVRHTIKNAWLWSSLLIIPCIFLVVLCLRWKILKDDRNEYYSLARTQLFAWTVIFSACYFFIWIKTSALPDITSSVLIILGISAGTTATAKVIENEQERAAAATIDGRTPPRLPSLGWIIDILTDRNGKNISVHRFQNVLFTVVFGVIFVQKVVSSSVLPDFDNNALILMGISSTTYAGLKITERE